MGRYVPHFRYYMIAENEFSPESLLHLDNLVARLFMLETAEVDSLAATLVAVLRVLEREASPELKRDFKLWVNRFLEKYHAGADVDALMTTEDTAMFETRLDSLLKRTREEGHKEERRDMLRLMLRSRFGEQGEALWHDDLPAADSEALVTAILSAQDAAGLRSALDEIRRSMREGDGR